MNFYQNTIIPLNELLHQKFLMISSKPQLTIYIWYLFVAWKVWKLLWNSYPQFFIAIYTYYWLQNLQISQIFLPMMYYSLPSYFQLNKSFPTFNNLFQANFPSFLQLFGQYIIKVSKMQKQTIKPYFHYNCKNDLSIIDSQYTYQGNYLAVCTSNASIFVYKSPIEQNPLQEQDYNPVIEYNQVNKNNCYLKLAWSFYSSSILAALAINGEISYFEFDKSTLKILKTIKCQNIPVFGVFLPTFNQCIFSVGFSDGSITLFDHNLMEISTYQAHKQSVNWLSWERRLGISQRNRWISQYFPTHVNQHYLANVPSMMASCSSDSYINFYKLNNKKQLSLVHSFKAHSKQIRQVMWRPNYFDNSSCRNVVSCSEDGYVKFWEISQKGKDKYQQKMKSERNFYGPVYRAQYNSLGTMIAISYYGGQQGKVETKIFSDKQEGKLGQQIQILQ